LKLYYKKISFLILFAVLVISFTFATKSVLAEDSLIADANLEKVICDDLHIPFGTLTKQDLEKVTAIYAYQGENIKSLKGLEYATNLTRLIVSNNPIDDIHSIAELKKLTFIDISSTQVSDLQPLSQLPSLYTLMITNTKVTDLSALKNLTSLSELFFGNNQISDLAPLSNLPLVWLEASHNKLKDVSALQGMNTLKHLFLENNQISDITAIESLANLEDVSLKGNSLDENSLLIIHTLTEEGVAVTYDSVPTTTTTTATPTPAPTPTPTPAPISPSIQIADVNLEKLIRTTLGKETGELTEEDMKRLILLDDQYKGDTIQSLKGLEYAINLKTLQLSYCGVEDISALQQLTQLEKVELSIDPVKDWTPLTGLTKLKYLGIGDNDFTDLSLLTAMTNLEELYVGSNEIKDYSLLKNFPHLTSLGIGYQQLKDISFLNELPQLKTLDFSYLPEIDLKTIKDLNLSNIFFFETQIHDLTPLKQMLALKSVSLFTNPVDADSAKMLEDFKQKGLDILQYNHLHSIRLYIDGKIVRFYKFGVLPTIQNGNTLVPLRDIFEHLGAKVDWDDATKTITAVKGITTVKLQLGNTTASVNGESKDLTVAPQTINGSTLVPLRFVSEAFGGDVQWDPENYIINITTAAK
jgi:Leucine-rich repeat (LRR) protein